MSSVIQFGTVSLIYSGFFGTRCSAYVRRPDVQKVKFYKDERDFKQVMAADASTFLKNPRLKIDNFKLKIRSDDTCNAFLNSLTARLDVRTVHIYTHNRNFCSILPIFKPGTLETITLIADRMTVEQFNEMVETEQWKAAKNLSWIGVAPNRRMEKLAHFKDVRILEVDFSDENLVEVRDILLKSAHLDYFSLVSNWMDGPEEVAEKKRSAERIFSQDPYYNSESRRFSIPDSRDYFQLEYDHISLGGEFAMRIRRISEI